MEATEDFRKEDFGLVPIRVERWGPFVFANLDAEAPPLGDVLGAIPDEVAAAGFDIDHMRLVERREYVIDCNWKVYVDNYLEGYHLPIAHPDLFSEVDYDAYRVEEFRYYSKQHAPIRDLKPGEEVGRDRRFMRTGAGEDSALYYWVFPNTMFNIYPDNLSSNVILPLGHERTLTVFEWFFAEPGTGPAGSRCSRGLRSPTRSSRRTSSSASRSSAACGRGPTTAAASAPCARTASTTSRTWSASSSAEGEPDR